MNLLVAGLDDRQWRAGEPGLQPSNRVQAGRERCRKIFVGFMQLKSLLKQRHCSEI
jgi:hypothetical protein